MRGQVLTQPDTRPATYTRAPNLKAALRPCMGGFCGKRATCQHYMSANARIEPAERLCGVGAEAEMYYRRISHFDMSHLVRGAKGRFA